MTISTDIIRTLVNRTALTTEQMTAVMQSIMDGEASQAKIAAFITALSMKGATTEEISAAATFMRQFSQRIELPKKNLVDIVGTGGDGQKTFNISTTSAFLVAAAGGKVAKHGTRSVLSQCGSADVLEHAGINLNLSPTQVQACVRDLGIGFLFAPNYHPILKNTLSVRKQLGFRNIFNILAPLVNPAGAAHLLLGVYDKSLCLTLAKVCHKMGCQHVLVVHAEDGQDEISSCSPTFVAELNRGEIHTYTIKPEDFGIRRGNIRDLAVNNATESYERLLSVLRNEESPARDIVLLNAGAAIYAANLCENLNDGITRARVALSSGRALSLFEELKRYEGYSHRITGPVSESAIPH